MIDSPKPMPLFFILILSIDVLTFNEVKHSHNPVGLFTVPNEQIRSSITCFVDMFF